MICYSCNVFTVEAKNQHYELCNSCIDRLLKNMIIPQKSIKLIDCICKYRCSNVLNSRFLKAHFPNKEYRKKYTLLFNWNKEHVSENDTCLFFCKCKFLLKYNNEAKNIYCPSCCKSYCLTCREGKHFPEINECPNKQKIQNEIDELSLALNEEVKHCPFCKSFISKEKGCESIICFYCNEEFCFSCQTSDQECLETCPSLEIMYFTENSDL